jgi:hypothetical protein
VCPIKGGHAGPPLQKKLSFDCTSVLLLNPELAGATRWVALFQANRFQAPFPEGGETGLRLSYFFFWANFLGSLAKRSLQSSEQK